MSAELRNWLWIGRRGAEHLVLFGAASARGVLEVPKVGPIRYERGAGGRLAATPAEEGVCARFFEDGAVLKRRFPSASPEVAGGTRRNLPRTVSLLIVAVACAKLVVEGVASISSLPATPSAAPPPAGTPEVPPPSSAPGARPPPRFQSRSRPAEAKPARPAEKGILPPQEGPRRPAGAGRPAAPWRKTERDARALFLRGEWAKAEAILADFFAETGRAPPELRSLAAEVYYAQCKSAFARRRWREAGETCERSKKLRSGERAREMLSQLSERARKLYLEGYAMEKTNRDAAIRRYREVLSVAPPSDEFRRKAARKLKAMRESSLD